jgi:biopolymer transport protein ExbD
MSSSLIPKKKHRHVLDLQLTAMIDIFSLIVIFLIKGTVFGVSDLPLDAGIKLPESRSKEALETAPNVQLVGDLVRFSAAEGAVSKDGVPLAELAAGGPGRERLESEIKDYLAKLPAEARGSGVLLGVIADRDAPYSKIFSVVRFFRQSGFDSLLFVAAAEAEQ